LKKGFDRFFGYNCQRHAHSYFPTYLYDQDRRIALEGNDGKKAGATYAQNLIQKEAERFIRDHKDGPFFLYYAITLPHGRHEIDSFGEYADRPWTDQQKAYAAQVTRLDADVGRLLALLRELGLDERTLVMTSGDNGSSFAPNSEFGKLFQQASNGMRGYKRELYEGGLRQAALARWPGQVPAGRVSHAPWAFWDFLPTAAELAGAKLPEGFRPDGFSLVGHLRGGEAPARESFYWELHEGASLQAARWGDWTAVRNGPAKAIEIYDLAQDPGERTDLAKLRPELVAKAESIFAASRTEHPDWPLRGSQPAKKKKK
jgi:arylsulfatase A-like enzyme